MMKKFMFFALASVAMLASCSSDDTLAVDESNVAQTQDGPAAIQIGMGGVAYTRGTGTVGGVASSNDWDAQQFRLYMLKKGTMDLATKNNTAEEAAHIAAGNYQDSIYRNTLFNAPDAGATTNLASDALNKVKYYPATGEYDFWAYRLDDAATSAPVETAANITVPFTIDGSQDILVAKAIPTEDDSTNLKIKDVDTSNDIPFYSARAARKNVQPRMTFKHLLSRLTFRVAPGNAGTADATPFSDPTDPTVTNDYAVHITGIQVKSAVKGTLAVASTGDVKGETQVITWDPTADSVLVSVMQRAGSSANVPLVALQDTSLAGKWTDPTPGTDVDWTDDTRWDNTHSAGIGEALLVSPTENAYSMIVKGYQWVDLGGSTHEKREFELSLPISNGTAGFVAGTSYNVRVVVYGLQKIEVYVTLTPWKEVDLDPIGQD